MNDPSIHLYIRRGPIQVEQVAAARRGLIEHPGAGEMLSDEYLTVLRNSWGKYDGQWAGVKGSWNCWWKNLLEYHVCDNPGARISTKEKPTGKVLYYRREY